MCEAAALASLGGHAVATEHYRQSHEVIRLIGDRAEPAGLG